MIITITIVAGLLLGFATSARTPADGLEDLTRNVGVGMAGAFVGQQAEGIIFNSGETSASVMISAVAAVSGAAILLFIVNKVRKA